MKCLLKGDGTYTHLLRNIELTSSWVMGGFFELAAMRSGRRNTETRVDSCFTYSSSHSTMPNTMLFLLRMLSAWSERMYSSTICFQRRRHSQPRKKLWTCKKTVSYYTWQPQQTMHQVDHMSLFEDFLWQLRTNSWFILINNDIKLCKWKWIIIIMTFRLENLVMYEVSYYITVYC